MSALTLMQKDGAGQMNVPPDKVEAYKLEGWTVIDRPPEPAPVLEAVELEPMVKSPAEDQTPADVDQVVERVAKRSKKG